jgi:transposase
MLGGETVRTMFEVLGKGESIRGIAAALGISRNTARKYLRSPGVPTAKKRRKRARLLEPFESYLRERLADGVENSVVLLREIRARGYQGGHSTLKEFMRPLRRGRRVKATVRFETLPGEQAQVDFGRFRYELPNGGTRHVWAFVMVLSWSRAIYVEFVPKADTPTFIRCHVNAFSHFGGIPERCLYDNTKAVVLGRGPEGQPMFNGRFLDFALRLGFVTQLCRPYRAQTKGRVESGIKYVRYNFWPTARFVDLQELNRQARAWMDSVADVRVHGTTQERPCDRLRQERAHLRALPSAERLQPFLREERRVGRDAYVRWQRAAYGVSWLWVGKTVQVQANDEVVEIWADERRLAVHPRALRPGQHSPAPDQWDGLPGWDAHPMKEALARQSASVEVEKRALTLYDQAAGA